MNRTERFVVEICVATLILGVAVLRPGSNSLASDKKAGVSDAAPAIKCPAAGCSLDIILQGPLVIAEYDDHVLVMEPILSHHLDPQFGAKGPGGDTHSPGNYKLIGLSVYKGAIKSLNPVAKSDVITVPEKKGGHKIASCDKANFCLELPKPDQIVPWNADPMMTSDQPVVPPDTPEERCATDVMLRYEGRFSDPGQLQIQNTQSLATFQPKMKVFKSGSEELLAILVLTETGYDTHLRARAAYEEMVKLVPGFVSHLDFPEVPMGMGQVWPMRNAPFNPDLLPTEVSAHLMQYTDVVSLLSVPNSKGLGVEFFPHADCKVGILRVTDAK